MVLNYSVIRVDLMQRVLRNALLGALGPRVTDIVWGHVDPPRPARAFGRLGWVSFPRKVGHRAETTTATHQSKYVVDVLSLFVGDPVKIRINGVPYAYTPTPADDLNSARDALVALINADPEPATAIATAVPGQFEIDEQYFGSIFHVIETRYTDVNVHAGSEDRCVKTYIDRNPGICSLQFFSADPKSTVIANLITDASFALDTDGVLLQFQDYNLSYRTLNDPTNTSGLEFGGAKFEGRAALDIEIVGTTMYAEPTDIIESADISITADGNTIPITVP